MFIDKFRPNDDFPEMGFLSDDELKILQQMKDVSTWLFYKLLSEHHNFFSQMHNSKMVSKDFHKYIEQLKRIIRAFVSNLNAEERRIYRVDWYEKQFALGRRADIFYHQSEINSRAHQSNFTLGLDPGLAQDIYKHFFEWIAWFNMLNKETEPIDDELFDDDELYDDESPSDEELSDEELLAQIITRMPKPQYFHFIYAIGRLLDRELIAKINALIAPYKENLRTVSTNVSIFVTKSEQMSLPLYITEPLLKLVALIEYCRKLEIKGHQKDAVLLKSEIKEFVRIFIPEELYKLCTLDVLDSTVLCQPYLELLCTASNQTLDISPPGANTFFDRYDLLSLDLLEQQKTYRMGICDLTTIVNEYRELSGLPLIYQYNDEYDACLRMQIDDLMAFDNSRYQSNQFISPPDFVREAREAVLGAPYSRSPESIHKLAMESMLIPLLYVEYSNMLPHQTIVRLAEFDDYSAADLDRLYWDASVIWARLNGETGHRRWLNTWLRKHLSESRTKTAIRELFYLALYMDTLHSGLHHHHFMSTLSLARGELLFQHIEDLPEVLPLAPSVPKQASMTQETQETPPQTPERTESNSDTADVIWLEKKIKALQAERERMYQELRETRQQMDKEQAQHKDTKQALKTALEVIDTLDDGTLPTASEDDFDSSDQSSLPYLGEGIILGGHNNWHHKLRAYLPNFDFVEGTSTNFDTNRLKRYRNVFCFTNHCTHKMYYRLKVNLGPEQKLIYLPQNIQTVMTMIHDAEESQ